MSVLINSIISLKSNSLLSIRPVWPFLQVGILLGYGKIEQEEIRKKTMYNPVVLNEYQSTKAEKYRKKLYIIMHSMSCIYLQSAVMKTDKIIHLNTEEKKKMAL